MLRRNYGRIGRSYDEIEPIEIMDEEIISVVADPCWIRED
jgi:hypothetical protein